MKNLILTLLICLPFTSCITNTTPAARGVTTLSTIAHNSLDTIDMLADSLINADAKLKIKAKVAEERVKVLALQKALLNYLEEYGEIDYKAFIDEAFELYRKYKGVE